MTAIDCVIVIVNYRTPELVVDCLQSIAKESIPVDQLQVIVVENDSKDDSFDLISQAIEAHNWKQWCHLVDAENNGGFAAGNNIGITHLKHLALTANYIWLVNPDTYLQPGAFQNLHDYMESHPEVGIAGSRLESPNAHPQQSAFVFPSPLGDLERQARFGLISNLLKRYRMAPPICDTDHETDWLAGASMMIRREVIDQIGLMDDEYFLYFEEVDFCLAAKRAGWKLWYVPESKLVHLVGASTGVTGGADSTTKRRPKYWFDARRRYFCKNHGLLTALLADVCWLVGMGIWSIKRMLTRHRRLDPPHIVRDFIANSAWVRGKRGIGKLS